HSYKVKYFPLSIFTCRIDISLRYSLFKGGKETFSDSIIVAIAASTMEGSRLFAFINSRKSALPYWLP
ncbi:hypothetical protein JYT26_01440, partial [Beggiatoa alba]|nr:hypothetical protein [Beggiatoa alba]